MKNLIPKPGSIKEMLIIVLPMLVSQTCDTVMIFTDRLFLSKLGPELMNAAMSGGLTVFMLMSFFIGLIGYSTALVAQYLGAKQKEKCAIVTTQTVIFVCAAYPIILLSRPIGYWFFDLMKISPEQLNPQKAYFNLLCYGAIISLLRISLSSFFSGIGKTRIVMVSSITAMVINVLGNYLLVYGKAGFPALGIVGSAYGTIIGGICGLSVLVLGYFSKNHWNEFKIARSFVFDRIVGLKLLRFGYPAGLELGLNMLAFNAMVGMFQAYSLVTATAATVMFNWDLVSFVPLLGAEIGVTSLVGRYMGANDPNTAHKAVMSGLKLGLGYSLIILVLFLFFPQYLINMFRPNIESKVFDQAIPLALYMIRLASVYVLVEALYVVFVGALRGAGDTLWAMGLTVGVHWSTAIAVFVSLNILKLPAYLAWVLVVVLFFLSSGLVYARYKSGKWRNLRVVEPGPMVVDLPPGV